MASKRPYDRSPREQNGRKKQMKTAPSDGNPSPGTIVFRLLCPSSKFGSLVGRGGGIVTKIRQETGAKIKIEESVLGSDERIVVVTGSDKENEPGNQFRKDISPDHENHKGAEGDGSAEGEGSHQKSSESGRGGKTPSSAERALMLVFDRIVSNDSDGGDGGIKDPSSVSLRMLILSSQVGCILGKGGSVIKHMSSESGAEIRILPKEKIPSCASPNDELLQISGHLDEVKKALQSVCHQLIQNPVNPNRDFALSLLSRPSGPTTHAFPPFPRLEVPHQEMLPPPSFHHPIQGPPGPAFPPRLPDGPDFLASSAPKFPENMIPGRLPLSPEPITFRLLCVNDKVGSVIGKGGSIIKKLHIDTGCEIKVLETAPDSEDRVITITGPVLPDDRISPPQDTALRLLGKIVTPTPDKENLVLTRILVSSSQIGCIIGKAGSIIAEMRRMCGAQIRVLGKDQLPKYILENDELVQISGEFEAVQEAVVQITSRLKHHLFRDRLPSLNPPPHPSFVDQAPPIGAFMGRREPSPPGPFSNFGPSFRKFDSFGGGPQDERPFAFPPTGGDRLPPPPGPWLPPGANDGGLNPMPMRDHIGVPPLPRRIGAGGIQTAVITNTTVDVVVPSSVVPSIYGEDGFSLKQIRQISGANITINDPKPGATETTIIISGAPDQTHAAQSLIQAFVMSESGSP